MLSPEPIANYMVGELNKVMDHIRRGEPLEVNPEVIEMAKMKASVLGRRI
jgi:hypothetical protein